VSELLYPPITLDSRELETLNTSLWGTACLMEIFDYHLCHTHFPKSSDDFNTICGASRAISERLRQHEKVMRDLLDI